MSEFKVRAQWAFKKTYQFSLNPSDHFLSERKAVRNSR